MLTALRCRLFLSLAAREGGRRRARKGSARSRGMTLIEIMVVLVILGLLAGAIGVNVFASLKDAQIKTAKLDITELSNAVDLFHVETGNWPDSIQQLIPKFTKTLRKDPWGNEYVFIRAGEGYEIYSYGPDKVQGGGDDITNKQDGK